jgi:hypothetical protein
MNKSDLRNLIKEEIQKVLTEKKGTYVGKWRSPQGNFINKYVSDEGDEYILVNGIPIDLTDGNGSARSSSDIAADAKAANSQRQSHSDYIRSMRGY